jgi:hypothetical protein
MSTIPVFVVAMEVCDLSAEVQECLRAAKTLLLKMQVSLTK